MFTLRFEGLCLMSARFLRIAFRAHLKRGGSFALNLEGPPLLSALAPLTNTADCRNSSPVTQSRYTAICFLQPCGYSLPQHSE